MGALAAAVAGLTYGPVYAVSFVAMYVTYEVIQRHAHTHHGVGAYGRFIRRQQSL